MISLRKIQHMSFAKRATVATISEMRFVFASVAFALFACDPAGATVESEQRTRATASASVSPPAPKLAAPARSLSNPPPELSATPERRDGCPSEMARIEDGCIDRWEAHLVEAASGALHPHFERPAHDVRYAARSASGVMPQAYVNRLEARAACESAGKRLCTIKEWYRACLGPKKLTYGYAARYEPGRCNAAKPHLLSKMFGNDPRNWSYGDAFNNPKLNQEPGFLARTGEHAECTNEFGVYDMIGNLHEWVSDRVDRSLVTKLPLRDDMRGKIRVNTGHGIFMGGFYSTLSEHGRGCGFITPGHEPKYHDYSTGFRCCKDASPGVR